MPYVTVGDSRLVCVSGGRGGGNVVPAVALPPLVLWPLVAVNICVDGDSISNGFGAPLKYEDIAATYYPSGYGTYEVISVNGETMATMLTNIPPNVVPNINTAHSNSQKAVCSCFGGTNDIAGGASASTLESTASSYFSTCKSDGADYGIAFTLLPRGGVSGFETTRTAYNAWLRSNYLSIGADVLVDVGADPSLGNASNLTNTTLYQSDQTHPTNTGQQILANLFATAIMSIGATCRVTSVSPSSGTAAGGTSVAITGQGFTSAVAVIIGGIQATSFTVNSDTSITATTGASFGTGTSDVSVLGKYGAGRLVGGWTWV